MAIKIGIAPDSWGVWFPASDPNNAKQPQWWRCLDEMKVAGYEGCEIGPWGYMPNDDPKVLKNAMDARGLTLALPRAATSLMTRLLKACSRTSTISPSC
mgnify:CR=1 FL=1